MTNSAFAAPQIYAPAIVAIDQLTVGPVQITRDRLVMPYSVLLSNGQQEHNSLIYKYEEKVFDPQQGDSQNLASVIGAQLALNYGLFCQRIIFDGPLDKADQRFLLDMLENTSREILVNKIYAPNVFLKEEAKQIPVVKKDRYTQAAVQFVNTLHDNPTPSSWPVDPDKYCVLSSGGKDSLLSYGLLKELGKEVYPIFGNESGRHWFTALNGYRYLKSVDTNTGRVWMNSDRMFAWMLRQLPFVRQDFANVRADDYPIRLWTVAVFGCGVLPLMKKHGIGRLVIGDEYDSSQRASFQGIPHYSGLYDQSWYFDAAFSRYFAKKSWGIEQFSILRPLSELLILKMLYHRYPELQQHQTSCHATHEKDGRIHPCGKCEKCRRIVGMLTALDGDPRNCGYSTDQIEQALNSLKTNKVKQIGPDAAHLFHLLTEKGILQSEAKAHPEIMAMRFDEARSPLDAIPKDLRLPLYELMLTHTTGAVKRDRQHWISFDLPAAVKTEV